jgi:hypothetical protein
MPEEYLNGSAYLITKKRLEKCFERVRGLQKTTKKIILNMRREARKLEAALHILELKRR